MMRIDSTGAQLNQAKLPFEKNGNKKQDEGFHEASRSGKSTLTAQFLESSVARTLSSYNVHRLILQQRQETPLLSPTESKDDIRTLQKLAQDLQHALVHHYVPKQ